MTETNLDDLKKRLEPTHLLDDLDELKLDTEKSLEKVEPAKSEEVKMLADPRMEKEYTFSLDWTDGRKKRWTGKFTNQILTIQQRQHVGILRARLASNTPPEALDLITNNINDMISHMAYSLVKKPKWAANLLELTDVALLQAIFKEVLSHEDFFHGYEAPEDVGSEESGHGDS